MRLETLFTAILLAQLAFTGVQCQVIEIRGDILASVSISLKPSVIRESKFLIKVRDEIYKQLIRLLDLLTSNNLTYNATEIVKELQTEVVRQKKLCVKYINVDFYLDWYNNLRKLIEKELLPTLVETIDNFLGTLKGKKIVRCWLAGKEAVKDYAQYNLLYMVYHNVSKAMIDSYTSYRNQIKALADEAVKNITKSDSASFFITNNKEAIWNILKGFIGDVENFSLNQTEATKTILNETYAQQLPEFEAILANITDCINTKVSKKPKT